MHNQVLCTLVSESCYLKAKLGLCKRISPGMHKIMIIAVCRGLEGVGQGSCILFRRTAIHHALT